MGAGVDPLDERWIHGSADCAANADPPFEARRFDPDTWVFRQNKCQSFEAPFLYLLFGRRKALLLDTGDAPRPPGRSPVAEVVDRAVRQWLGERGRASIDLVVAHSHAHRDHVAGDRHFVGQPHTTVVKPSLESVTQFFGLADWPNRPGTFDLGQRVLTIIPTPGHEPAHIAVYDAASGLLLTGDTLYPGVLTIDDWPAYRSSIIRLAEFGMTHPISGILGAHIEMKSTAGAHYEPRTPYQPDEHVLSLRFPHLLELRDAVIAMGERPMREARDDFVILPIT
jgi:hydroxyacylglutathione hydrolase